MRVDVGRAGVPDWPRVRDVRSRALADAPGAFASDPAREEMLGAAAWRHRVTTTPWFLARTVAEDGGVGGGVGGVDCGLAAGRDDPGDAAARMLVAMWVDPAHRGGGIADALVAAVAGWAREQGATALSLWVVDTNVPAWRCYRRLGFAATGERGVLPGTADVPESRLRLPLTAPS